MTAYHSVSKASVAGKTLLVRVDLNVPMQGGQITNTARIDRLIPSLRDLAARGAKTVLISHFGRPKGKVVEDMSLRPLAPALTHALKQTSQTVQFIPAWRGPEAAQAIAQMAGGDIALMENIRFDPGEAADDAALADDLAALGDIYVNDAFSAAHRAHASTHGLAHRLPAYAGALMVKELEALEAALGRPKRPVMAVVGGAKVSTKFDLLENLSAKVDQLVIGGGMANTFLFAQGKDVGTSLCEPDLAAQACSVLTKAAAQGCTIILPSDAQFSSGLEAGDQARKGRIEDVPQDQMILDFGPESTARVIEALEEAQTLIWNGPLGAFEFPPFDRATKALAQAVAKRTKSGHLVSIAGGGDTVAALTQAGAVKDLTYVSTAGGAFLEWMEGQTLPGVAALEHSRI